MTKNKAAVVVLSVICLVTAVWCSKTDAYAAEKKKLETVRVIKEIRGTWKLSEDKNEISTLKWTTIRPEELHGDEKYTYRYTKSGLVKKFEDSRYNHKYEYIYDDNRMVDCYYTKRLGYGWIYDKGSNVVKYNVDGTVIKRYIYNPKKKYLIKIKEKDGYKEYSHNEKKQITQIHTVDSKSYKDPVKRGWLYEYDGQGNIVTEVNEIDEKSWVQSKSNFKYNSDGNPVSYEYGYYDCDSDKGPDIAVWHLGKYTIDYKTIKVPKKYIKTIKQQQWEIINHFYTEEMFYDVITPYLKF